MAEQKKHDTNRRVMKGQVWLKAGHLKWFIVVLLLTSVLLATASTALAIPGSSPVFPQLPPIFLP